MQVEEKRACASCGSENAPDAGFCWRCLTPFAPAPPVPFGARATGLPPAPATWGPPLERPVEQRRSPSKAVRVLVSLAAAVGGYLGVQYLMGPSVSLPDTLAGSHRLTDAGSQRFEKYMADEGDRYGIDAEGGVYGSAAGPRFFVILVDAAAVETTDQLFDALITGFSQAGAVVDGNGTKSGQRGSSEFRCAGARADAGSAVACMWRDDGNVGIVVEVPGDLRGTRQLLWTVHDTVVG
jgi:hypothetical protein